jgi:hypothetical protein
VLVGHLDREQLVELRQRLGQAFSVVSTRLTPRAQISDVATADTVPDEVAIVSPVGPPPEETPSSKAEAPHVASTRMVEAPPRPAPEAPGEEEVHWQAFWSQFHSELSARGFAERLARRTGTQYRVRPMGRGVYEVVFAYQDDAGREAALERIESATGLRLREAPP